MATKTGGGGLGFVMAIVVLVIVMLLAGKAWNAVMPTAQQALNPNASKPHVDDHGQKEVGDMVRSGSLPGLKQLGGATDQHIQQVQDAAKKQD
ncbi:MAG TPA: hypothetical protein VFC25_12810 [Verrucomicrobiae bacterium]|nr:hypothetical protein [Verrucomicrobiae bacterium]